MIEVKIAYYKTCDICGNHLDPGETCDCREVSRINELRFARLTRIRTDTEAEQIEFNFDVKNEEVT